MTNVFDTRKAAQFHMLGLTPALRARHTLTPFYSELTKSIRYTWVLSARPVQP